MWVRTHRFEVLCVVVFAAMAYRLPGGPFGGDFWQHAAAVRELATHPLHPRHPLLAVEAPTPYFSPYTLGVALLARAGHADPVTALSAMGLANLALLFVGLRYFVGSAAFYALLLTLFGWGTDPWLYSGFFHIGVLGYVLPYPSTFAMGLTLLALAANDVRLTTGRDAWLAPLAAIAVIVLLSHPFTFLFLAIGLVSQACAGTGSVRSRLGLTMGLLILVWLVALSWPYFPLARLLGAESGVFDTGNREMYEHVLRQTWPTLIGVPVLVVGFRANWRRPLVLMLMGLSAVYAYGGLAGRYSYGRVVPAVILLMHVEIAGYVSALESGARRWGRLPRMVLPASLVAVLALLAIRPIARTFVDPPATDPSYAFLGRLTGQYDVVLSDLESSKVVPAYGGKVVAAGHPFAFVRDQDVRQNAVARFFDGEADDREREAVLARYGVNHLLLRKTPDVVWEALKQTFGAQGHITFEDESFVLVSFGRTGS